MERLTPWKCLVVTVHPLTESLCTTLTRKAVETLKSGGHQVTVENLYQDRFDPTLTKKERETYYSDTYDHSAVAQQVGRLLEAEAIVLLFPTWWFGFPAVLKGWFDRVWGPGIAYDHASDYGPIKPRLSRLKRLLVVTTLGAPWWVDRVVMRQPVKRIVKTAMLRSCAPQCKFEMQSLYKSESLTSDQVQRFAEQMAHRLKKWC